MKTIDTSQKKGKGRCISKKKIQNRKPLIGMATTTTSKSHRIGRPTYRFLPTMERDSVTDSLFEFDESELYNVSSPRTNSPEFRKSVHASRFHGNSPSSGGHVGAPASLPVNVPDWSKILGNEYRQNRRRNHDDYGDDDGEDDDEDDETERVPPHEFLARTRMASLSVHEGVGRTLKGRDLSRVRNAIWAKTGFQD